VLGGGWSSLLDGSVTSALESDADAMRPAAKCRHPLICVVEGDVRGADTPAVRDARQNVVRTPATRAGSRGNRHAIRRSPPELRAAMRHRVASASGDHLGRDQGA
jgi:hypothetical protein